MDIFDDNILQSLFEKHGAAVYYNENGLLIGINQMFFAELFHRTFNPVYDLSDRRFYLYNEDNGLWETQEECTIILELGMMVMHFSRYYNAIGLESKCTAKMLRDMLTFLTAYAGQRDFFTYSQSKIIHCGNGVLVYSTDSKSWELKPFEPEFRSQNRSNIIYDPEAKCPQFTETLILSAMSRQDADLLRLYVGQCLIGCNLSQMFLMLTGTAGGGKTTLVNVIEALIGRYNCTELRLEHMHSRFELQRLVGKTLLTAKDVKSDFLTSGSAYKLKSLVGNDTMTIESKGRNDAVDIQGNFNAIITSNNNLRVVFDGDNEAWRRRMLWIKYDNPPPKEKIVDFDKKLMEEESSGILNWALAGAIQLISCNGKISRNEAEMRRIDSLLLESDAINVFIREFVQPATGTTITGKELLIEFTKYCKSRNWKTLPERAVQRLLPDIMLNRFNAVQRTDIKRQGKNQRGYSGFRLAVKQ